MDKTFLHQVYYIGGYNGLLQTVYQMALRPAVLRKEVHLAHLCLTKMEE